MDILNKARQLESQLARRFDRAAQQWAKPGPRGPLELLHAIAEAVDEGLEPAGRGTHIFPFNRIHVSIVAGSAETRARVDALLSSAPTLTERIAVRLRNAGCEDVPPHVSVAYVDEPSKEWPRPDFHVEFERVAATHLEAAPAPPPDTLWISVLNGTADQSSYVLARRRINLGRCAEVRDGRNQLLRNNDIVFSEAENGPNATVSRRHAHIESAPDGRDFRICDDGSVHGTSVVRNGRTIGVPRGARGVRLCSGDEVLLGEARLRVRIG